MYNNEIPCGMPDREPKHADLKPSEPTLTEIVAHFTPDTVTELLAITETIESKLNGSLPSKDCVQMAPPAGLYEYAGRTLTALKDLAFRLGRINERL